MLNRAGFEYQATIGVKSGIVVVDGKTLRACKGKGIAPRRIFNAWSRVKRMQLPYIDLYLCSYKETTIKK